MEQDKKTGDKKSRDKKYRDPDSVSITESYQKDIVKLKVELDKLREKGEIYRIAYKESPDSINVNRLSDGLYVSINEGFTRIMGYTEEEIIGKTSVEMNIWANPDDRASLVKALEQKGEFKDFEARFLAKDGTTITGLMSASIINIEGIPHIISITRDVTKSKRAEEELQAERNLLRTLIDNMPDRIYAKDLNSRFIICNQSLIHRMGMSDINEITGKSDFDLLPKEQAQAYFEDEQEIMRTGKPLIDKEEYRDDVPVSMRWSLTTKVPLYDSGGNITGIVGIGKNITERKRNEMENQVMFEIAEGITATDNLDELIKLIHKSLSKVVYADNCFVALYDQKTGFFSFPYFVDKYDPLPSPMAMEKSCTAYVFRNNRPFLFSQDIFDRLVEQNEVEQVGSSSPSWIGIPLQTPSKVIGVLVLQHYEKENIYSESDVKFLVSVGSQIAISIERKKAEEEIILKNELLQVLNAEKDKFFSILAHDLRGPLSSFVAATQIITEEIQSMSFEEIKDITLSMKNDASNIYTLLENLLEWSRLKRNVMEFVKVKFNLRKKIESCLQVLSEMAEKKRIETDISVPQDLELTADEHMFDTIIRNLVSNAIKFIPAGGKINISAIRNQDNFVEISITDTGIGIPDTLKNKLFLINEKTSRKGTEGEPSSGLGLLLCKEFIEKHDGRIWVESQEGKGSTFSFTLPV